jgi:hypothetical protein
MIGFTLHNQYTLLTDFSIIGKRYNVLRRRTDSWEYDTDQLLFGTILFTLLAFLFPTVLAYYALFALVSFALLFFYPQFRFALPSLLLSTTPSLLTHPLHFLLSLSSANY